MSTTPANMENAGNVINNSKLQLVELQKINIK